MEFRALEVMDFGRLLNLVQAVYNEDPTSMWFREFPSEEAFGEIFKNKILGIMSMRALDLVVLHENEIIGECEIAVKDPNGTGILGIIVRNDFRRKGIGRELLKRSLEAAGSIGIGTVYVEVIEGNKEALLFFRKSGFTIKGISDKKAEYGGVSHTVLLLERDLLTGLEPKSD